ncbi:MAG: yusI [Bacillales bacterium]|nr:yusI [Bacillales bacterium]
MIKFYCYPKCSTCQKAKKWLDDNKVKYEEIHIVENNPTKNDLAEYFKMSGFPINKFFNTSGIKYREMGLSSKVKSASEDDLLELLSSDGMLVKRPLITDGKKITLGFKPEVFEKNWLN